MDSVSAARLAMVYPDLAEKVMQMDEMLEQEGIVIRVVQGLRTWQEQDKLYAQGRTESGKVVTNAPGGHSYHNFGLAVDCAPFMAGDEQALDWNAAHPSWKRMEAVGVSLGLVSGANWIRLVDAPHFQLTGRFPEAGPDDELRQIWRDGGNGAVWMAVEGS
jgi:peptidoglycan LD-endopeptidase CwlK